MCSKEEIVEMARRLFEDYDTDYSYNLNRKEVKVIFETLFCEIEKTQSLDSNRVNKLFTVADLNNDGVLSFKEFIKLVEDFLTPHYL